jgi:hypothetical protein
MLYHSILYLGSNELGPVNSEEMMFAVVTLLTAALLNALLFGDVASLMQVLSRKQTAI